MKITGIALYNYNPKSNQVTKSQSNSSNTVAPPPITSQLPSTNQYIGFTGGYSLNLSKTIKQLDKLAEKHPDIYPPNVREWAGMILEEGNKSGETLVNIHKKLYENLKECKTLQEIKAKFPEFKNVISAENANFSKGSFYDDVKKGNLEYFDKDEDISVQLLKLYWGEGFSLNDLKAFAGNKDLFYTINKLRIPRVNSTYGNILKLSDPEYNARLTSLMSEKKMGISIKRGVRTEPQRRAPFTEEHRENISKGIKKYHDENPEALFKLSESRKKWYKEHPEEAEVFSRVVRKAWYIFNADSIKNALSNYIKKNGTKDFNAKELEAPLEMTGSKSKLMQKFWADNEWARKSFSKNMEFSWKKVKEENEMSYIIDVTPNGFKEKLYKWAEGKGYDIKDLEFSATYYPHKPELNDFSQSHVLSKYTRAFVDEYPGDESSKMANSYFLALLNINRDVSKLNLSKASSTTNLLAEVIKKIIKESLFVDPNLPFEKNQFKKLDSNEAQRVFSLLQQRSMDMHEHKIIEMFNKNLNKAYDYLDKNWKPGDSLKISPYGMNL